MKNTHRFACVLFAALPLVAVPTGSARADFTAPGAALFTRAGYDYAPTVIQQGTVQTFWWCGSGPVPGGTRVTDVIFHRAFDFATGQWTAARVVLGPTDGRWDGAFTCDPSVVRGAFRNPENGRTYSYAMYYGGTDDGAANGGNGAFTRVGLAYSNDGTTWVKYSAPVIVPQELHPGNYGAGQPSAYNFDGRSGVYVFHLDASTAVGARFWVRRTTDGVNFGSPILLSTGGTPGFPEGSDFAYDYNSGSVYAALGEPWRNGDRAGYRFGVYRMQFTDAVAGRGTWEFLGDVNTNLTGYYLNINPGLLRDGYGNLTPWLPNVQAYFGVGGNDSSTWDLSFAIWRPTPATLPLQRFYNAGVGHHWVTTGRVSAGYSLESTLGYLPMKHEPGTIPLYGCQNGVDHFVSIDPNCEGRTALGENGAIYTSPQGTSTRPLYRCFTSAGDHFVSPASNCEGQIVENGGNPIGHAKIAP